MKSYILKLVFFIATAFIPINTHAQNFHGEATYISKSKMELGNWGSKLSEEQKKQVANRLKNRLEKKYILSFNSVESSFIEEEKIDAVSGATDSWGGYFSRGDHYKNTKESNIVQSQEFYGKRFLVKDKLYRIEWTLGSESKKIGEYTCYRAKAFVPYSELNWFNFSWGDLSNNSNKKEDIEEPVEKMIVVEAWYASEIPISQGPAEYWGLPGFILEVSAENTTLLCTEFSISKEKTVKIVVPEKGKEITKEDYTSTVRKKMVEMRNNRMGRRG